MTKITSRFLRRAFALACLFATPFACHVAVAQTPTFSALPAGFAQDFTGTYGSQVLLSDGFTHTEKANVVGGRVELTHEFVSRDGQSRGSFRWSGSYAMTGPDSATANGQGVIENLGQRAFSVTGASLRFAPSGIAELCWKATDPKFGAIGGCSPRLSAIAHDNVTPTPAPSTAVTMPVPVAPAPLPVQPAPAPIAVAPVPVPAPAPVPAPVVTPPPAPAPIVVPAPAPVAAREIVVEKFIALTDPPVAGVEFIVRATVLNRTDSDLSHAFTLTGPGGLSIGPQSVITKAGTTGTLDTRVTLPNAGSQVLTLQLNPVNEPNAKVQKHQLALNASPRAVAQPVPLPAPIVTPQPPPAPIAMPTPPRTPVVVDFTGTYESSKSVEGMVLSNRAVVTGDTINLQSELASPRDGKSYAIYRWSGQMTRNGNGSGSFSGQGTVEDTYGTRPLGITNGLLSQQMRIDIANNRRHEETSLCWSGSDSRTGKVVQVCAIRSGTVVSTLPALPPVAGGSPANPTPAPAPVPIPVPAPAPAPAPSTAAFDFTGFYSPPGNRGATNFTLATVKGEDINLQYEYFNSATQKHVAIYRWSGRLMRNSDGSASFSGEGMAEDALGRRTFTITRGRLSYETRTDRFYGTFNEVKICWSGSDPKSKEFPRGEIGETCSLRTGTITPRLPQLPPIAVAPTPTPVPTPVPGPNLGDFTGTYRSQTVLPDGFTHTETAVVNGTGISLIHQFVSKDGRSGGHFRWNGTLVRQADGSATVTGQGIIDNLGQRNFRLEGTTIRKDASGNLSLCWKGVDPKFGPIGGCSSRQSTGLSSLPQPLVFAAPTPAAIDFTGTYRSQTVLPDGYTHTETAVVTPTTVSVIHQFVSKDGRSGGHFRWNGALVRQADGSAMVSGQGIIDNLGQRNFTLEGTTIRKDASGNLSLCWKGVDPKFGPIGGCSSRQSSAVTALPQPMVFPAPVPQPAR